MFHFLKKLQFLFLAGLVSLSACTESDIFPAIPLTLDPPVLANPISMAVSPSRQRLYVINSNNRVLWVDGSLVIFDISDPLNPVAIQAVSFLPFSGELVLDETAGFLYVTSRKSENEANTLDQLIRVNIEESSPNFLETGLFESFNNPFGLASLNDQSLFVAAQDQVQRYEISDLSGVSVLSPSEAFAEEEELDFEFTRQLGLSPNGEFLWLSNENGPSLILHTPSIPAPVGPGAQAVGVEAVDYLVLNTVNTRSVGRDSEFNYVVEGFPSALRVLDLALLAPVEGVVAEIDLSSLQVASIPLGVDPGALLVDASHNQLYVSNQGDDNVSVIDTQLFKEVARISISTTPETLAETGDIDAGDQPYPLALSYPYLYVGHYQTNLISIINVETFERIKVFP